MRIPGVQDKDRYSIRRIRLIKFHNIENETIELNGHLFLLGDNGSGKTTILDAIHYVLTGGDLELNAAARVAGRRAQGRTAQGIIMRYNADTGPLNKSGGITYAALELATPGNKILTIGIGMTTASMDERISQWGIVETGALEEIPFLITDLGGTRPSNKLELKRQMGANAGVYNMGGYRKELARRLFGGEDSFPDVCRLLSMGKAYREIVANSADYHELFVRLLPEPRTDVFERLIDGLHDLDGALTVLDEMDQKAGYLNRLTEFRDRIASKNEELARYLWLQWHVQLEELGQKSIRLKQLQEQVQKEIQAGEMDLEEKKQARDRAISRLDDLKARDKAGLVRQEKDLASQVNHLQTRETRRRSDLTVMEKRASELDRQMKQFYETYTRSCISARKSFAAYSLSFGLSSLLHDLDQRSRLEIGTLPTSLEVAELLTRAGESRDGFMEQRVQVNTQLEALELKLVEAEMALKQLLDQQEIGLPEVDRACRLLADNMIEARPLYELLAWKPTLRKKAAAEIETFIGSRILGMLVVDPDHFARAQELVFARFPSLPITHEKLGLDELPAWIRESFDLADPIPLTLLAAEMASHREPNVLRDQPWPVLAFRAHRVRFELDPANLIGTEARRRAWEDACRRQKLEIRELKAQIRDLDRERQQISATIENLDRFLRQVEELRRELESMANQIEMAALNQRHLLDTLSSARADLEELVAELKAGEARLVQMRRIINEQGLDRLERDINRGQREVKLAEDAIESCNKILGQHEERSKNLNLQRTDLERRTDEISRQRSLAAEALQKLCPEVEDVEYYVTRVRQGFRFTSLERIEGAARASEREKNETKGLLRAQLEDPTMAASYGFYYEDEANSLIDRRGRDLAEALAFQNQSIESQRQVINDKTIGLFKEIILNELVQVLRSQVFQLEDMVKHINRLLNGRDFGTNRYRFVQKPQERYQGLVEIIRKLSVFEEEAEQNLREFFEDHREEILNTEPGDVPAILDYRNWYRFEMTVTTTRDGSGEVTMNRRVKATGSGGEQAVPNYLLVLTIAYFLYHGSHEKKARLHALLFDEAFYGIDSGRRDQLLGFADDLGLQLMVASPDQDGVKNEIAFSKTLLVMKDAQYDVHVHEFDWENPAARPQLSLLEEETPNPVGFTAVREP